MGGMEKLLVDSLKKNKLDRPDADPKTPIIIQSFSAESLISDNLNTPVARARAVNGLAPGRDTGVQGRDVGLQLSGVLQHGREPLFEYAAGVFRGQTFVAAPAAHYHATAGRLIVIVIDQKHS